MKHNWSIIPLSKICRPTQWKTISQDKLLSNGFPVYGANGTIGFYSEYNHEYPTILITCRGATCGTINICEPKSYVTGNAMALDDLDPKVDFKFIYYQLKSRGFTDVISGSAQPQITRQGLEKVNVIIPPLPEQRRIAAILDKADCLRRKRAETIKMLDQFLRSVFLEMFGDPVRNEKGWAVEKLSDGITSIEAGWSANGEGYPCSDGQKGVLKISAVTSGQFNPNENKFVSESNIPTSKKLLFPKKNDLLFSRANTRELVAATCIVTEDRDDVFLPDKLWRIETKSKSLLSEYLHFLIRHQKFRDRLTSQATGTSGSMLNISKSKFENTRAPFPPLIIQERFSKFYWSVERLKSKINKLFEESNNAFNSLTQRAFRGEL